MHLTVAWDRPRAVCECHFVGSEAVVAPLRQRFVSHVSQWYVQRLAASLGVAVLFVLGEELAAVVGSPLMLDAQGPGTHRAGEH